MCNLSVTCCLLQCYYRATSNSQLIHLLYGVVCKARTIESLNELALHWTKTKLFKKQTLKASTRYDFINMIFMGGWMMNVIASESLKFVLSKLRYTLFSMWCMVESRLDYGCVLIRSQKGSYSIFIKCVVFCFLAPRTLNSWESWHQKKSFIIEINFGD